MTLRTEGKTLVGGEGAAPRQPCLRLKRNEVGQSPTSCPQGLGKASVRPPFFLVLYNLAMPHKCDSNSAFAKSVQLYCYQMSHGVVKVRMGLV